MSMIDMNDTSSTRPYLIRALYEWCTDNGLTPYVSVAVNERVQVPFEFVKDGEIVLNISFDATTALKLGNDYLEFNARFGGVAREIIVPIEQISGIYARENGQGMAFPISASKSAKQAPQSSVSDKVAGPLASTIEARITTLVSVESSKRADDAIELEDPPRSPTGGQRPTLTRIK
jgi:stringent starvation protein B